MTQVESSKDDSTPVSEGDLAHSISWVQPNAAKYRFIFRNESVQATFTGWGATSQEAEKGCGNCYK